MTSINPERAASLSPTQQPQHAHTAQVEDDSAFESLVTSSKALLEALQTWVIANTRHVDNVNLLPLPATTTTTVTTSATARSTDTDEQPAPSPSTQDDDTAALHDFDAAWTSYYNFFEAWKDKDAQRLLKTLLDHAQQLESLWRTVQSDPTARSEWGPRIEEQRRDLRNKARQLVGPDGVARVDIVFADFVSATTPSPPSTAAVAAAHSPGTTITATPPVTPAAVSTATPMETDTETAAPEPHAETVEPSSSSAPLEPTTPLTAAAVTATKKRQRVLSVSNTDSAMDVDEPSATLTGGRSTQVVTSSTTGRITAAAAPSDDPTASTGEEPQPKKPTRARGPRQPMLPAGFKKQDNWSNLQLIHELALDPNFKIESQRVGGGGSTSLASASDAAEGTSSSSSSGNSMESLESRIRAMATKAYFDKIREDAEQGQLGKWIAPLLTTIREQLLDMVPPESTVARQIRDGFDLDFVQQQVDEKVYNVKGALESVLALMAKLCAPVRDPAIRKIQQDLSIITGNPFQQGSQALPGERPAASATPTTPKDLVSVLKDILELLEEMLMDLANYRLMVARPSLEKQAIPYEQHAFKTSLENGEVTLDTTTAWLEESAANVLRASLVPTTIPGAGAGAGAGSREPSKTNRHYEVYVNAVLDLLYSKTPLDMASKEKFPETFVLDQARLTRYQNEIQALALISVMWNISLNVQPPLRDEGQEELKQTLFRLMESASTSKEVLAEAIIEAKEKELLLSSRSSSSPSSSSSSTLTPTRSTATATAPTTTASLLLSPEQKAYLHNTIERAISFDSTLYNVLSQRIRKVLESYLLSSPPGAKPGVMPDQAELNKSGLGTMAKEIGAFAAQVGFLIRYNAKVYQPWYDPLLTKILPGNTRSPAKPRTATATSVATATAATAVTTTSAPIVPPAPDAAVASTASGEPAETTVSDNAAPPSTTTTAPKVEATEQVKDKDGDNSNNDKTPSTSLPE